MASAEWDQLSGATKTSGGRAPSFLLLFLPVVTLTVVIFFSS